MNHGTYGLITGSEVTKSHISSAVRDFSSPRAARQAFDPRVLVDEVRPSVPRKVVGALEACRAPLSIDRRLARVLTFVAALQLFRARCSASADETLANVEFLVAVVVVNVIGPVGVGLRDLALVPAAC